MDSDELEILFTTDTAGFVERVDAYGRLLSDCEQAGSDVFNYFLGLARVMQSRFREAERAFNRTLSLDPPLALEYRTLTSIANLHFLEGDYSNAFAHGIKLSDAKYTDIPEADRARGKIVIANALIDAGLFERAADTLATLERTELPPRMACVAHYVGIQLLYKQGRNDVPIDDLMATTEECRSQGQELYALLSLYGVTRVLNSAGEAQRAKRILEDNLEAVERLGYASLHALWLAAWSENALARGDVDRSIEVGLEALAMENTDNILEVELAVHQALALAYQLAGNRDGVLKHSQRYHDAYARAHNRQLASATAYFAAQMQEAQRAQEIELLNKQKSLLELENALARSEAENFRLYLFLSAIAIVLISILAYRSLSAQRKLHDRVKHDKLTGVFSRDHFENVLEEAIRQAKSRNEDLGFILFDLDHFKRINDNFGHPVGDWVLQQVAEAARPSLRKSDALGRLGGEEFGIVLPDCPLERAREIAESVRVRIEAIKTRRSGFEFRITASFGVTSAASSGYEASKIVSDADAALYGAKTGGRNRVSVRPAVPATDEAGPREEGISRSG